MLLSLFLHNGKTTDRLVKEAHELALVPNNRELDVLLSSGEQVSISKLSILLNELGYSAVSLTGWQAGIYTNNTNQNAVIENIDTSRIVKELNDRKIVVIAGFQGYNENLDITTLGRGGSDTTAVAVAAALNAKHCYIFSDVDGVYTTDPNKYPDAKKIESLSYVEMIDIANEGAKVLHNRCIEIGERFNIPIITQSTFNNKSGSVINDRIEENVVKSIVKNDDIILIELKYFTYSIKLFNQVYECLIDNSILPIQFFNRSGSSLEISFLIKASDINKFQKLLENELKEFDTSFKNISRIAIIGYGITSNSTSLNKIIDIIKEFNVNIYSTDITNTKIIFTFDEKIDNKLLDLLHNKIFE
jgi:aspartate kinase